MKKNYFAKKPKRFFIAFFVLLCGLFANTTVAQDTFTWNGSVSNNWATAGNWTKVGTNSADTFPGQTNNRFLDLVIISNGGTPTVASNANTYGMATLTISNATGAIAGSVLTINSGATLRVGNTNVASPIALNGGTIANNGTLTVTTAISAVGASFTCGTPANAPISGSNEYGYIGGISSTLTFNNSNDNTGSSRFSITSTNAFTKYKFVLYGTTANLGLGSFAASFAVRTAAGASPVSIGGAGFSTNRCLFLVSTGASLTVESGTTITSTVASNTQHNIILNNNSTFINKGNISIGGAATNSHGIQILNITGTLNLTNEGTLDVNITPSTASRNPLGVQNGSNLGTVTITNTGTMSLKNTRAFGSNLGNAFMVATSGTFPTVNFTNSGNLTFSGTNVNTGGAVTTTLTNNGTITSNQELRNMTLLNNSGKTISFVKDASTIANANALNTGITFVTNHGIIQTGGDTTTQLRNLSGVAALSSTSSIEPGGAIIGIADFANASAFAVLGTLKLDIAGTTAGTTHDLITNSVANGGFNIAAATLNVTGIYTPGGPVTLDIVTASAAGGSEGTIVGTFSSVIGLTSGWSVNYIAGTAGSVQGKVQLVYSAAANTWTGATSTAWTAASNWSLGVPDLNSNVTIVTTANQPTIATNVTINSLTINSGTLTVNTGANLTVTGAIVNNGGTMTFASNSNLIQEGTTNTNSGNITVNRNSNLLSRLDYTIWSSPVTGSQTLTGFSPETFHNRFYNYNQTTNLYDVVPDPSVVSFDVATGYLIRMPNNAVTAPSTQIFQGSFTGVPNSGTITKAMTYTGPLLRYNMVGNPYPSTIDAQTFITVNTANIESSLYFWRKVNAASGSAYAVYNPLGETTATPSSALPNGLIQVGQGFFVLAKSASDLTFTNAMRVANNENQFFKTKQTTKDRLWLNLTNASGAFSQALVGYTADATIGLDNFDGIYINDSPIALTSSINNLDYTIQGRPSFDASDVVALNFKTNIAGDYRIALDHFDGVFAAGQDIYLLDSKTGIETDLKAGSYTFAATAGVDNARFSLKYQKTLKVDAPAFNENSVRVYRNKGTLYVNSANVTINNIKVFDIQGRLIVEQKNVKAITASMNNLKASNQVLIVKITGEDNNVVTKKVVN